MDIIVYSLLPVLFMLHEFEEIIFLKIWLNKDKEYLIKKFPKIGQKIYSQYNGFTISGFTLAIAEEFILISILTYVAIIFQKPYIWFTIFVGFSIHIVVHIFQWIIYRKYFPTIVTSALVLPYCIYGLIEFVINEDISIYRIICSSIIGIILLFLNLMFIHYIGHKFSNVEKMILK